MQTEREYLVSKGLAKPTRGRFNKEAKEELARVKAAGMQFVEKVSSAPASPAAPRAERVNKPKPADMPNVDGKAVREWGRSNGWKVGDRGRLDTNLITAYLADKGDGAVVETSAIDYFAPTPAPTRGAESFRGTDIDGTMILVSNRDSCFGCQHAISHCRCAVPTTFSRADVKSEVALTAVV